jgi:spermidine/putrescine transport system substrate-binding protein
VGLLDSSKQVGYHQPDEFMIFTDSAQIPVGAPHAYTAEKMLDFCYEPEIQALITANVAYVPPVKGAREALAKKEPELAKSPLVFPDLSNAHNFKTFSPAEQTQIDTAFQKAIGA